MSASRTIVAAYPGTCRKCGAKFPAGTKVHWSGKGQLAHDACPGAAAPESERAAARAEASAPVEDADLDELIALDDALSGVPLVGAVGAGGVEGHARAVAKSEAQPEVCGTDRAAGVESGHAPTAPKTDATVEALQQALRELHAITRDLAASVRVLTSAAERIARPETPVPAGHWTAALPPTEAGAEMEPGDPL